MSKQPAGPKRSESKFAINNYLTRMRKAKTTLDTPEKIYSKNALVPATFYLWPVLNIVSLLSTTLYNL